MDGGPVGGSSVFMWSAVAVSSWLLGHFVTVRSIVPSTVRISTVCTGKCTSALWYVSTNLRFPNGGRLLFNKSNSPQISKWNFWIFNSVLALVQQHQPPSHHYHLLYWMNEWMNNHQKYYTFIPPTIIVLREQKCRRKDSCIQQVESRNLCYAQQLTRRNDTSRNEYKEVAVYITKSSDLSSSLISMWRMAYWITSN